MLLKSVLFQISSFVVISSHLILRILLLHILRLSNFLLILHFMLRRAEWSEPHVRVVDVDFRPSADVDLQNRCLPFLKNLRCQPNPYWHSLFNVAIWGSKIVSYLKCFPFLPTFLLLLSLTARILFSPWSLFWRVNFEALFQHCMCHFIGLLLDVSACMGKQSDVIGEVFEQTPDDSLRLIGSGYLHDINNGRGAVINRSFTMITLSRSLYNCNVFQSDGREVNLKFLICSFLQHLNISIMGLHEKKIISFIQRSEVNHKLLPPGNVPYTVFFNVWHWGKIRKYYSIH